MGGEGDLLHLLRAMCPSAFDARAVAQATVHNVYIDMSCVACSIFQLGNKFEREQAARERAPLPRWRTWLARFGAQLARCFVELPLTDRVCVYFDNRAPELKTRERAKRQNAAAAAASNGNGKSKSKKSAAAAAAPGAEPSEPERVPHVWPERGSDEHFACSVWFTPDDEVCEYVRDIKSNRDAARKFNEFLTQFLLGGTYEVVGNDGTLERRFIVPVGKRIVVCGGVLCAQTLLTHDLHVVRSDADTLRIEEHASVLAHLRYGEADLGMVACVAAQDASGEPPTSSVIVANDLDVPLALLQYRRVWRQQQQHLPSNQAPPRHTLFYRHAVNSGKTRALEYVDIGQLYEQWTDACTALPAFDKWLPWTHPIDVLLLLAALQGTDYTDGSVLKGCTMAKLWRAFWKSLNILPAAPVCTRTHSLSSPYTSLAPRIDFASVVTLVHYAYDHEVGTGFRKYKPTTEALRTLCAQSAWYMGYFCDGWKRNVHIPTGFEQHDGGGALFGWMLVDDDSGNAVAKRQIMQPASITVEWPWFSIDAGEQRQAHTAATAVASAMIV